ncbi:peptidoglycan editing factor PgeF [Muribacter muris]|uniref:Purine nucleoside phosphorylase n=1 Tax=Muribacter muris TaxID=67855 RepID=A0A4Y9K8T7_9PAST|nr:peptidoglycan editing factor PgeF [Muribacter muris]MBF0784309.1 peptidoglycan editing factor PgeF [Muribacter muris]MBF0826954.1 peptidoglycan editing factor PgeF [Muribacter muris]TFV13046.1 peptidoglycan editing factor PgeF [Muribacter muris]
MEFILPNWSVPAHIHALTTTRSGGVSQAPFESLNVGEHVNDDPLAVRQNRTLLQNALKLPNPPVYLTQTHSTQVLTLPHQAEQSLEADAVYTDQPNQVCLVMTADCLPALFCSEDGTEIAAAHAGWRGLCDGVLEATAAKFRCLPHQIRVWLGPAIGATAFQVGQDVIGQFCAVDPQANSAFVPDQCASGKFLGDLYQIARQRLQRLGITQISGGDYCTYTDSKRFFSYRRENMTGRMATLIWRSE